MLSLSSALLLASTAGYVHAQTSSLQQIIADVGPNPTDVGLYYYKPTTVVANPPLIVAMHECTADAQIYYSQTDLPSLADQYGFILIYPSAPTAGGCWDVASNATLTHNLGGDSLGIASAARWAVTGSGWGVDASRVFATGTSSGAMMTSVLMGAYPDVFAAGSLYSGVADGCFEGPTAWNTECAEGDLILTPAEWGARVYAAYPGYTGKRPPVQFWHGTVDTTLYPQNFYEEIKQWTYVFNVSETPTSNLTNNPQAGYSRATYGPNVQAILAQGVGHTVPEHETDTLTWFGIIGGVVGAGGSTVTSSASATTGTASTTVTAHTSTTSTASGATQTQYGQCGGTGWTGATTCASPYKCNAVDAPYYYQCL